jgi:hypothetical protein
MEFDRFDIVCSSDKLGHFGPSRHHRFVFFPLQRPLCSGRHDTTRVGVLGEGEQPWSTYPHCGINEVPRGDDTMKPGMTRLFRTAFIMLLGWTQLLAIDARGQTIVYARQGFTMRLCFDNKGTMGRVFIYPGPDSIGLEYPIGSPYEHIYCAGPWVGGKLDTAQTGTSPQLRLVSTPYEGWAGPLFEFYPGSTPADTIWKVAGQGVPRPPGWEWYWGNLIARESISDNDHYCMYRDDLVSIVQHIPLKLKLAQSSFVWSDPYAEGIHIIEYKIVNEGEKQIDSVYVGLFLEHYVARYPQIPYFGTNRIAYYPDVRTAYAYNTDQIGPTPVGVALLGASRDLDSLRLTFQWWPGPLSPVSDLQRYTRLSSDSIMPDQIMPLEPGETKGLLGCGPFTIRPASDPQPDTVVVAFGIVSAPDLTILRQRADRARVIYVSGGQVGVDEPRAGMPSRFELLQNYPNPFNPATRIVYRVGGREFVSLRVFDLLGREVTMLVNEIQDAGFKSVEWNAAGMASGVYICRMKAGDFVQSKKLVLTK